MTELKIAASNIGWDASNDDKVLTRMNELGFAGLEIAPTRIFPDNPYAHLDDFANYSSDMKDKYVLEVCSLQSIWRGRTENLFDPDGAGALLDYTSSICDFAKSGSVANLVFGCPKNRIMPEGKTESDAMPFLMECGQKAHDANTVFALEANPEIYGTNFLNTTKEVVDLISRIDPSYGLGINLDIGAIIENDEGLDVIETALPYVSHVHISEPYLAPIEKRPLHSEVRKMLETYGYDGFISLEMGTAPLETVEKSLEYMTETFLD